MVFTADRSAERPTAHAADARSVAIGVSWVASTILVSAGCSLGGAAVRVGLAGVVAAGVLVVQRRWLVAGGVVTALYGAIVASVGVGFVRHLFDGGSTLTGTAAAVATVAGLALTVLGMVEALRRSRWPSRIAGTVGALAVTVVIGQVIVPAVLAANVPPTPIGDTPGDRGLTATDVTLHAADGVDLATWYLPSTNGAAVVVRHGAGSTRSSVLPQAIVLARHGYGVLLMDARGHGDSGGRAMDFGWYGDLDIAAGIEYLRGRSEVDPERIGIVGSSMGGEEAIGASAGIPAVRAVVADGATGRVAADKTWYSDAFGVRGTLQQQVERLQDRVTELLSGATPPTSLRAAVEASVRTRYLLITAGDVPDEGRAAAHIRSGAPGRVEVWTIPRVGHTGGLDAVPTEWEARVVEFLDAHL